MQLIIRITQPPSNPLCTACFPFVSPACVRVGAGSGAVASAQHSSVRRSDVVAVLRAIQEQGEPQEEQGTKVRTHKVEAHRELAARSGEVHESDFVLWSALCFAVLSSLQHRWLEAAVP